MFGLDNDARWRKLALMSSFEIDVLQTRAAFGWSQASLAERAGVAPMTVRRMEKNLPVQPIQRVRILQTLTDELTRRSEGITHDANFPGET